MQSKYSLLRNGLLITILVIVATTLSVAAEDGGFPSAFGWVDGPHAGPNVQSGPAVVKLILRLAEEEGYTYAQSCALADALTLLLNNDVPPGIILNVSVELLEALSPADLLSTLGELGQRILAGEPPGQVANDLLERGNAGGNSGGGNGNGNAGGNSGGGNGNGNAGSNSGGENGNGNGNAGGENGNGNGNAGGGNGNGNAGGNSGGGNGNGNSGGNSGGENGNGSSGSENTAGNRPKDEKE